MSLSPHTNCQTAAAAPHSTHLAGHTSASRNKGTNDACATVLVRHQAATCAWEPLHQAPEALLEACESVPHVQHDASLQRPAPTCSPRPNLPSPAECCLNSLTHNPSIQAPHVPFIISMIPSSAAQCFHHALSPTLLPTLLDTKVPGYPLPAQTCH